MRSTQTAKHLRCLFASSLFSLGLLGSALVRGCATPPPPVPPPSPAPVVKPPPPPPPMTQREIEYYSPPPIIIHQADLHGQFESKQGSTITIRALLMMTKTQPAVGNKGTLFCSPANAKGEEWVPMGDVEVKKTLDPSGKIEVKIIDDEKKFVIPGGKRPSPLVKNTRIKLRWEW